MDWGKDAAGLFAGFVLATLTTPVGVSGAVFLLPVQLSILGVPSPQITPTNLLYNVISGPGGLLRFCGATSSTASWPRASLQAQRRAWSWALSSASTSPPTPTPSGCSQLPC